jgi:hypothetical protein
MENPYQKQARYKKAVSVVDILEQKRITDVDLLTSEERSEIERLAGVRRLSEESWEVVKDLHQKRAIAPFS